MKKILSTIFISFVLLASLCANSKVSEYGFYSSRDKTKVFYSDDEYNHMISISASYTPYPYGGWDVKADYNYIVRRFGIGPGISYKSWEEPYNEVSEYGSIYSYGTDYGTFSITFPIRLFIIPLKEFGFTLNFCVEPDLNFVHIYDYNKGIDETKLSYGGEFRLEGGCNIAVFFAKAYVGYNINSLKKDHIVIGASCGFAFEGL